jgi:hypothetical protein
MLGGVPVSLVQDLFSVLETVTEDQGALAAAAIK